MPQRARASRRALGVMHPGCSCLAHRSGALKATRHGPGAGAPGPAAPPGKADCAAFFIHAISGLASADQVRKVRIGTRVGARGHNLAHVIDAGGHLEMDEGLQGIARRHQGVEIEHGATLSE
jgi:hypothetical protein